MLLRGARERHGRAGQVGQRGAAGRAADRRRAPAPCGNTDALTSGLWPANSARLGAAGKRNPALGANPVAGRRLGAQAGLGLQEGEDARVLGVLGLHPLHGGEVMH